MAPQNKTMATSTPATITGTAFATVSITTAASGVADDAMSGEGVGLRRSKRVRRPAQKFWGPEDASQEMMAVKKTAVKRESTSTPNDQDESKAKKPKTTKQSMAAPLSPACPVADVPAVVTATRESKVAKKGTGVEKTSTSTPEKQSESPAKKWKASKQPMAAPLAPASPVATAPEIESPEDVEKRLSLWVNEGDKPKYHGPWWKSTNSAYPDNEYVKRTFSLWGGSPQKSSPSRERELKKLEKSRYSLGDMGWLTEQEAKVSRKRLLPPSSPGLPRAGVPPQDRRQFNLDLQRFQLMNGLGPLENLPKPPVRRVVRRESPVMTPARAPGRKFRFRRGPWSVERGPGAILKFKSGPWSVERVVPEEEISGEEPAEGDSREDGFPDLGWTARPRKAFHERDHVYGPGESPEDIIWIPKGKEDDSDDEDSGPKSSDETDSHHEDSGSKLRHREDSGYVSSHGSSQTCEVVPGLTPS